MKDIAIYGAGGLGREVACLIKMVNRKDPTWNLIGFFDDAPSKQGTSNEYGPVLGGMDALNAYPKPLSVAVAVGNPAVLHHIVSRIQNDRVEYPNLYAPDTIFLDRDNVRIGRGNIVCVGCSISCHVVMGDFNLLNGFVSLGHDTTIGSYNAMMTAVRIAGEVTVGDENLFGSASVVLQQVKIGNRTTIGANSTVIRKTKDGHTYIGNPARRIKV
jgi:sugar O-acyltransferase (sialic acid O-acetyltransferase NeuD family)